MDEQYDNIEIYCRKLGHHLTFEYCRKESDFLPCSKIIECWNSKININEFCSTNYKKEDINRLYKPTKPKIATILDIIQNVKVNNQ
jgi:hypothetical protein